VGVLEVFAQLYLGCLDQDSWGSGRISTASSMMTPAVSSVVDSSAGASGNADDGASSSTVKKRAGYFVPDFEQMLPFKPKYRPGQLSIRARLGVVGSCAC